MARRGRNGESSASSRATGASSRSPPPRAIPPPRITSSGSSTGATAAIASAIRAASTSTAAERSLLAPAGRREHGLGRAGLQSGVAGGPHDRGARGGLLEEPAAAHGGVVRVAGPERQVADLARGTRGAAMQLAADHDPEADAGADPQEAEVGHAAAGAERALPERRQVDVVLEARARPELGPDRLDEPGLPPPGQVRGERELAARRVEHAGVADGRVRDLRPA